MQKKIADIKNMLQQLLDAERGNTFLRMNLLNGEYTPIMSNIKMSVIERHKNEDGSFVFVMANTYEIEESIFIQVEVHLSPDLTPTLKMSMSPMSRENAFQNMLYFKCLSQLMKGRRFYLADNQSDFWASGVVQHDEKQKILVCSKTFVKRKEDNETVLVADPEGKCALIFKRFFKGNPSDEISRIKGNA